MLRHLVIPLLFLQMFSLNMNYTKFEKYKVLWFHLKSLIFFKTLIFSVLDFVICLVITDFVILFLEFLTGDFSMTNYGWYVEALRLVSALCISISVRPYYCFSCFFEAGLQFLSPFEKVSCGSQHRYLH